MNAHAFPKLDALPTPLRSEAFAEDLLEYAGPAQAVADPLPRWLVSLAPLAVAMMGVAFALVPPLV
jgi:hypothetical protein